MSQKRKVIINHNRFDLQLLCDRGIGTRDSSKNFDYPTRGYVTHYVTRSLYTDSRILSSGLLQKKSIRLPPLNEIAGPGSCTRDAET